jgi:phosphate uptake regulator
MKRKIVKQGSATLTVSLPSKWTKRFSLKQGDEIEVDETGNNLILKPRGEIAVSKTNLDIKNMPSAIAYRYIIGAYKKGSDEITIEFTPEIEDLKANKKIKTIPFIQSIVDKLIGVEILEQSSGRCVLKQITQVSEDDFDIVLRRIFLLLLSLSEESLAVVSKTSSGIESVDNMHDNIDKFVNYCIRLLNKKGHEDKTSLYYYTIQELEEISDTYGYLAREFISEKRKISKETIAVFKMVNETLRTFYEYFYDSKKDKAAKIIKDRRKIFSEINKMATTHGVSDNLMLSRLAVVVVKLLNLTETRISIG